LSDALDVDSELEVFTAGKAWIQHNPSSREQHLTRVMDCVRFAHMENHDMISILRDNDFLYKIEYFRKMMRHANW
jgi:hypothetical protein